MQKIRTTSLNQIHSLYFDIVRSLVGVLYICSFNEGGILQFQNPYDQKEEWVNEF